MIAYIVAIALATGHQPVQHRSKSEKAALLKRDAEWAEYATHGKDVNKIVSYWSDDATVYPPGQPIIHGKKALRAYVAESLKIPGFKIQWTSSDVELSPDNHLAFMHSTNQVTIPGPDGKLMTIKGRGITVWRKEKGVWECVIDIWNSEAPG